MSILDDAIREHLELKRAHGADEAEVKRLEDEAFGPPQRPDEIDPMAEAPTEFLTAPEEVVQEASERREPNLTDLQEAPEQEEAPADEEPIAEVPAEPAVEEQPAGELALPEEPAAPEDQPAPDVPKPDGVHTIEEREAIADQPTQMFDVQAEIDAGAGTESPSDEELLDASSTEEPRLTPVEPEPHDDEPTAFDDDDDFFSEQRLSDELNAALEAPVTDEEPPPPAPSGQTEEGTAIYDIEEHREDSYEEEGSGEEKDEPNAYEPDTESHDDVLEDTPDFLEDSPEDDDLWFEQKPPKDFDFDD